MAERGVDRSDLARDTEMILATRPGVSALRTAACPSLARCVDVFADARASWTDAERKHFQSCPYCFEVGAAMAKASSRLARQSSSKIGQQSRLERLAAAIGRILRARRRA